MTRESLNPQEEVSCEGSGTTAERKVSGAEEKGGGDGATRPGEPPAEHAGRASQSGLGQKEPSAHTDTHTRDTRRVSVSSLVTEKSSF